MVSRHKEVWMPFAGAFIIGTLAIMAIVSFLGGFLAPALDTIFYPRGAVYETAGGMFKSKGEKFADVIEIIFTIIGMFILFFYLKAKLMPQHQEISEQDYRERD